MHTFKNYPQFNSTMASIHPEIISGSNFFDSVLLFIIKDPLLRKESKIRTERKIIFKWIEVIDSVCNEIDHEYKDRLIEIMSRSIHLNINLKVMHEINIKTFK